ncbi:MAG: response regulator [Phenylobacterium sp.]|nr:response regulator [Phenylobacterium sp.]MBP8245784.1 response regulator [Phenylobacterium sp.]
MNTPHTLLIVEDEILPAMALEAGLEEAGYQIMDLTSRPEEALAAARERKPDLALVNIKLHGRNDGIALAVDLKALGIPVLFISGQPSRAAAARSVALGSLAKPYSVDDMVAAVAYLLARLAGDGSQPRPRDLEVFDEDLPEVA